jgi:hypothetical protein
MQRGSVGAVAAEKSALLGAINIIRETRSGAKLFDYIASDKTPLANLWVGQNVWPFQGRDASGIRGIWLLPTENTAKWGQAAATVNKEAMWVVKSTVSPATTPVWSQAWVDRIRNPALFYKLDGLNAPVRVVSGPIHP